MTPVWTGKKILCLVSTLLLLLTFFGNAHADGGDHPLEQEVAGYHVDLVIEEPVKVGENEVMVKLRSEEGASVDGAIVEIEVESSDGHVEEEEEVHAEVTESTMNMGNDVPSERTKQESVVDEHAMAEMVMLKTGHEPGEYQGSITLPKAGNWKVKVHFKHQDVETMASFPISIAADFSKTGIIGGFLSVNMAVVGTAAVLKRKTAAAKKAAAAMKTASVQ